MRPGRFEANGSLDAGTPDQRLTLILSIFRLYRAPAPDAAVLERIADAVHRAEALEGGNRADPKPDIAARRVVLCDAVVRRFLNIGA